MVSEKEGMKGINHQSKPTKDRCNNRTKQTIRKERNKARKE